MPAVHPRRSRARAAVVTALVALPVLCLALGAAADRAYPGWDDQELAVVLGRLRDRTAEFPHRPLELVLGSSRSKNAFDTDGMSTSDPDGPVVLNLSLTGGTPLDSLLLLRRAVAEGHRPRSVILEVIPCFLNKVQPMFHERRRHLWALRFRAADLPTLGRIAPEWAPQVVGEWAVSRLFRWHVQRADLWAAAIPGFASPDRVRHRTWHDGLVTPHGWYALRLDPVPPDVYARALKGTRAAYEPPLRELDGVGPVFEAVMEEFFAYCRQQGIAVRAVVFTPENRDFRSFYGPGVQQRTAELLGELCRRHSVPFLDARGWLADDRFLDGHHVVERGAREFTRRFLRERH
jgi:hypothetical protein